MLEPLPEKINGGTYNPVIVTGSQKFKDFENNLRTVTYKNKNATIDWYCDSRDTGNACATTKCGYRYREAGKVVTNDPGNKQDMYNNGTTIKWANGGTPLSCTAVPSGAKGTATSPCNLADNKCKNTQTCSPSGKCVAPGDSGFCHNVNYPVAVKTSDSKPTEYCCKKDSCDCINMLTNEKNNAVVTLAKSSLNRGKCIPYRCQKATTADGANLTPFGNLFSNFISANTDAINGYCTKQCNTDEYCAAYNITSFDNRTLGNKVGGGKLGPGTKKCGNTNPCKAGKYCVSGKCVVQHNCPDGKKTIRFGYSDRSGFTKDLCCDPISNADTDCALKKCQWLTRETGELADYGTVHDTASNIVDNSKFNRDVFWNKNNISGSQLPQCLQYQCGTTTGVTPNALKTYGGTKTTRQIIDECGKTCMVGQTCTAYRLANAKSTRLDSGNSGSLKAVTGAGCSDNTACPLGQYCTSNKCMSTARSAPANHTPVVLNGITGEAGQGPKGSTKNNVRWDLFCANGDCNSKCQWIAREINKTVPNIRKTDIANMYLDKITDVNFRKCSTLCQMMTALKNGKIQTWDGRAWEVQLHMNDGEFLIYKITVNRTNWYDNGRFVSDGRMEFLWLALEIFGPTLYTWEDKTLKFNVWPPNNARVYGNGGNTFKQNGGTKDDPNMYVGIKRAFMPTCGISYS